MPRPPSATVSRMKVYPTTFPWSAFTSCPAASAVPPRLEPVLIALLFDEERTWRAWVDLDGVPEPVTVHLDAAYAGSPTEALLAELGFAGAIALRKSAPGYARPADAAPNLAPS